MHFLCNGYKVTFFYCLEIEARENEVRMRLLVLFKTTFARTVTCTGNWGGFTRQPDLFY
jgi:hypothetical protein